MNFRPKDIGGKRIAIVSGVRTPFGKSGTKLAKLSAVDLGVRALQEAVAQSGISYDDIDHVVIGNVAQPANAANISRVISLYAGVPKSVPAFTVQRNCASGLESISQAAVQIATGQAEIVVAGGTESMSQIPLLFSDSLKEVFFKFAFAKSFGQRLSALSKLKLKYLKPIIGIEAGLRDPVSGDNMGETAENLARDWGISREDQDRFALKSHQKAIAGRDRLREEIAPVYPPSFRETIDSDIGPRENQTMEQLAKLRPYFDRKHGSVTVGNACPVTDGAAMVVMMSEEKARAEGYPILGLLHSVEFSGCEPSRMGLGPAFASPRALDSAGGFSLSDMDLVEINEAFAAQVIACLKAFESKAFAEKHLGRSEAVGSLDESKLNVNGGAIALGHPVGTSGTRLLLTVLKELKRQNKKMGLATMCIGGGQGGAAVVEAA